MGNIEAGEFAVEVRLLELLFGDLCLRFCFFERRERADGLGMELVHAPVLAAQKPHPGFGGFHSRFVRRSRTRKRKRGRLHSILDFADDLPLPDDIAPIDIKPRNHANDRARELDDLLRFDHAFELAHACARQRQRLRHSHGDHGAGEQNPQRPSRAPRNASQALTTTENSGHLSFPFPHL